MLNAFNSLLIMIDVQEKLVNALNTEDKKSIEEKTLKIINAAKILKIDTIVTEQYPKGLGTTLKPVIDILGENYKPFEKTNFSVTGEENIFNAIKKTGKKQIVVFGMEAHICVFQTAIALKEKGYEVFVVSDGSFSRKKEEKEAAFQNMRHTGILTPTVEMVLFMWLKGSSSPCFKEVQALIK